MKQALNYSMGPTLGIFFFVKTNNGKLEPPTQRVDSGDMKFALTHVAFVCNKKEVQQLLPQVIIGSEAAFQAGQMQNYLNNTPSNVYLLR